VTQGKREGSATKFACVMLSAAVLQAERSISRASYAAGRHQSHLNPVS